MIGARLGHYLIEEKIGEGGMGIVYKARDMRLLRSVAVKILSPDLVSDEKILSQFIREAQTASALNHPYICTVHDVDETEGIRYIVMEWVNGKTLSEKLAQEGPLPEKNVIEIGAMICEALAAAHEKAIIHRDIKPDNIMITASGQVKVMDFGLAKLLEAEEMMSGENQLASSFTATNLLKSSIHSLQGTAAYMSPEQIRKQTVDPRTDLFSLGIVLYELLTGVHPFEGADSLAVMEKILHHDTQPPSNLRPQISRDMDVIILKALAKRPPDRYKSATEWRTAFVKQQSSAEKKRRKRQMFWSVGILAFLLVVFALTNAFQPKPTVLNPNSNTRPEFVMRSLGLTTDCEIIPSFFPNSEQLFHLAYNVQFGKFSAWNIDLQKGKRLLWDRVSSSIFSFGLSDLSPRGDKLVFWGLYKKKKGLYVVDTTLQNLYKISDFGSDPKWSPNCSQVAFSTTNAGNPVADNAIFVYSFHDTSLQSISPRNGLKFRDPEWSPDGRFVICTGGEGSLWELWLIDLTTGKAQQLIAQDAWVTHPIWSPTQNFVYFLSNKKGPRDLWRIKVDLKFGKVMAAPEQLTEGVNFYRMDISPDGRKVVFSKSINQSELWRAALQENEVDSLKGTRRLAYDMPEVEELEISPDGNQLVIESFPGGMRSLSLLSLLDGRETMLYNQQPVAFSPSWSPDGKWIAFDAGGGDNADIWRIPVAGGQAEKVIEHPGADWMPTYAPDGKHICFLSNRSGHLDLWMQDLQSGEALQMTNTVEVESRGSWSHSGHKIAYFHIPAHGQHSQIRIYDLKSRTSQILKEFSAEDLLLIEDHIINFLAKVLWRADDKAVYYRIDNLNRALTEVSLETGKSREIFSETQSGGSRIPCGFTISKGLFYFIQSNGHFEIWMAEGL